MATEAAIHAPSPQRGASNPLRSSILMDERNSHPGYGKASAMQQASTLARVPAAPAPDRLWSADEFMELPLNLKLYELVRGVLVEVPMTGYEHGEIESNIMFALQQHVRLRGLGQVTPGDVMFRLERIPIHSVARFPDRLPPHQQRAPTARSFLKPWKSAPEQHGPGNSRNTPPARRCLCANGPATAPAAALLQPGRS